ncbi:MAG: GNAT family N-acetyltransferase [Anaerolineae bacterium]|nr:GNAT family N-acetyltransferase [Anaerolineae bacterium]
MTHSRAYQHAGDLLRLQRYSAERFALDAGGWLHPGDIPHRLFNGGRGQNPADLLRLWEDEVGEILGWALVNPRNGSFDVQSHDDAVLHKALTWIETKLVNAHIETELREGDSFFETIFTDRGFAPNPRALPYHVLSRALDHVPPVPALPPGFSIRTAAGVHEAAALAAVHASAFNSNGTAEQYARVMESPGYAAEREFVVVAPDGRFAAMTVTWHDALNRLGYFEPVGTHADFRRLGLARAMMIHAMGAMRAAGMGHAWVVHEAAEENPASAALYASLGFTTQYRTLLWAKDRKA